MMLRLDNGDEGKCIVSVLGYFFYLRNKLTFLARFDVENLTRFKITLLFNLNPGAISVKFAVWNLKGVSDFSIYPSQQLDNSTVFEVLNLKSHSFKKCRYSEIFWKNMAYSLPVLHTPLWFGWCCAFLQNNT